MKFLPNYLAALYNSLFLALEGRFHGLSDRHALSASMAVLIILVVIALGALFVYVIITTTGTGTTTSVYP